MSLHGLEESNGTDCDLSELLDLFHSANPFQILLNKARTFVFYAETAFVESLYAYDEAKLSTLLPRHLSSQVPPHVPLAFPTGKVLPNRVNESFRFSHAISGLQLRHHRYLQVQDPLIVHALSQLLRQDTPQLLLDDCCGALLPQTNQLTFGKEAPGVLLDNNGTLLTKESLVYLAAEVAPVDALNQLRLFILIELSIKFAFIAEIGPLSNELQLKALLWHCSQVGDPEVVFDLLYRLG